MSSTYTYSLSADFSGNINSAQLHNEIEKSTIFPSVIEVRIVEDDVDISFTSELTVNEKTTLDNLVSLHGPVNVSVAGYIHTKIVEESTPTDGRFSVGQIVINALANTTTSKSISWPYNISALSVAYKSTDTHEGDIVTMSIGENTTTGVITADISPAIAWTSQNYTIGQCVLYNSNVYTCILDTVSNEDPSNTTYWKLGFEINVNESVCEHVSIGNHITLSDGTNTDPLGEVIEHANMKLYVLTNPSNSYTASTPTYVSQTNYIFKDFEIGPPWYYVYGETKIGGACIKKNVNVTVHYQNLSPSTDKKFVGIVELLR